LETVLYLLYKSFGISPLVALATIFDYKPIIKEFKKVKKICYKKGEDYESADAIDLYLEILKIFRQMKPST
jgi:hypothetical protein